MKKTLWALPVFAILIALLASGEQGTASTTATIVTNNVSYNGKAYFYSMHNTGDTELFFRANIGSDVNTTNMIPLAAGASWFSPYFEGRRGEVQTVTIITETGTSTYNLGFGR